jgi:hypothetical protein
LCRLFPEAYAEQNKKEAKRLQRLASFIKSYSLQISSCLSERRIARRSNVAFWWATPRKNFTDHTASRVGNIGSLHIGTGFSGASNIMGSLFFEDVFRATGLIVTLGMGTAYPVSYF